MSAFVGTKMVETDEEIKTLIDRVLGSDRCYFLRWPDKVSGLCRSLPDGFPSPEGEVFTSDCALRWKAQGKRYSVLLLSTTNGVKGFDPIDADWGFRDLPGKVYPATETRLPQEVVHRGINIEQRYFLDKKTETVHFVAFVKR